MSGARGATSTEHTRTDDLAALRADFEAQAGRSLSLPIAGAVVWSIVAVAGVLMPERVATLVLLFGTGAIFPLGLLVARALGERLIDNDSPLAALMGMSVLMVNLLWAVHLSLWTVDVQLVPLTLAVVITYGYAILALAARPRCAQPSGT